MKGTHETTATDHRAGADPRGGRHQRRTHLRQRGQRPRHRGDEGGQRAVAQRRSRPARRRVPRCTAGCSPARRCPPPRCPRTRCPRSRQTLSSLVLSADLEPGQVLLRPMLVTATQTTSGLAIPPGMMALTLSFCLPEVVAGRGAGRFAGGGIRHGRVQPPARSRRGPGAPGRIRADPRHRQDPGGPDAGAACCRSGGSAGQQRDQHLRIASRSSSSTVQPGQLAGDPGRHPGPGGAAHPDDRDRHALPGTAHLDLAHHLRRRAPAHRASGPVTHAQPGRDVPAGRSPARTRRSRW